MSLFEVLASSKAGLLNEHVSTLLAWLLNPYMDHGLHFLLLRKLVGLVNHEVQGRLDSLILRLRPPWRDTSEDRSSTVSFSLDIEFPVNESLSYIDIVIFLDDWIFSVENKIDPMSATDTLQLKNQYDGLKRLFPERKIASVFVVPDKESTPIQKEFSALTGISESDCKVMVSWDEIADSIEEILNDERAFKIDPLLSNLHQILSELIRFIRNDFEGFPMETVRTTSGDNPLSEGRKGIFELNDETDYIGINYGVSGLLQMDKEDIKAHKFQYTTANMEGKRNWFRAAVVKQIAKGLLDSAFAESLRWEDYANRYPMLALYRICKYSPQDLFIGVRGGVEGLKNSANTAELDDFLSLKWQISDTRKNAQWIDSKQFLGIVEPRIPGKV
jgi:hypothetical protein